MRPLLALLLSLAVGGCAALLGTKQKDFDLNSAPPGAEVYLNGNRLGTTPVRVKLSNQATHTFVFRREGYREATCSLNRGTDAGWVILDVLTGLVPIIIDAATGSWSQTKGDGCTQSLEPLSATPIAETPSPAPSGPPPAPTVRPSKPTAKPELVDDVPHGTNWIANARTRTYYRVGCPITTTIRRTDRLYYGSETSLLGAGFTKSEECSVVDPVAEPNGLPSPDTQAPPANQPYSATPPPGVDSVLATPHPLREQGRPDTPASRAPHSRSGFWFNGGLGYGSLGCQGCNGRDGGLSGGLALGGTLGQKVLLGVGTNGWYKSQDGITLSVGTLAALLRFYPSATGGFFLLGGLGIGSIRAQVTGLGAANETGFGAVLGLGYDVRIGNNVSLTPFWNGFGVSTSDSDANVGQLGLGVTVH